MRAGRVLYAIRAIYLLPAVVQFAELELSPQAATGDFYPHINSASSYQRRDRAFP